MAPYRLFVGCSFREERTDLRNYISEQVQASGRFVPVFGSEISPTAGPADKVRSLIKSCHAAMIVMTAEREGLTTPWIYSEIGMAFQERLPIFALVDANITDTGITRYCVCYETFDPTKFTESKGDILRGLFTVEASLDDLKDAVRTPANVLRKDLWEMLPSLIQGLQAGRSIETELTKLRIALSRVLADAQDSKDIFPESDSFTGKLFTGRAEKQRIADYIYTHFLNDLQGTGQEIVLDSGTVTFTICEKLVREACMVPIITNNIAVGRHLSELPRYPCFILPGRLESRYLASLGEETENYLIRRIDAGNVKYGIIAATSFSYQYGIAGNDPRHASFKKLMLEHCPTVIVTFEGEKIIREDGIPIYGVPTGSAEEDINSKWFEILKSKEIYLVTHQPEHLEGLTDVKRRLFYRTIESLKEILGDERVIVLEPA